MKSRPFFLAALLAISAALSGCASGFDAASATVMQAFFWGKKLPPPSELDRRFEYIWVDTGRSQAYLARGSVEPHPQGPIEVFYSASAEVLRLQNGRIVGAAGMPVNWTGVSLAFAGDGKSYQRTHHETPGYRFGMKQDFVIRQGADVPANVHRRFEESRAKGAKAPAPTIWQEELGSLGGAANRIRIGFADLGGRPLAVYGEQCLSASFCLTWQRL